ncbi:MAG: acyltransferase family protein [Chloroflexota bacterium]|nr:MAG: acyltransferase family protein [Chloroflexota bacterium]
MGEVPNLKYTSISQAKVRLHYLDWLRVIAILMVFLFHAVHPFDFGDWQVKNVEQSEILTIILTMLGIWGMPFFFMLAGAASWFALQRRSPKQYIRERVQRLLIPFIVGTILFSPIELYLEWANKMQRGVVNETFQEFVFRPLPVDNLLGVITPRWFGYGFHLWFLGFLFSFALFTLPFFGWLRRGSGQNFTAWLARLSEHRGGLLLFLIPPGIIYCLLSPFFPEEHDWADFIYQMSFFIIGFILFSDGRFVRSVCRDWQLLLVVGVAILLGLIGGYLLGLPVVTWSESPQMAEYYIIQFLASAVAICFSLTLLFIGVRFLDFSSQGLRYSQDAALPFFVLHQPVIIVIAFFAVQWEAGIPIKMLVVLLGSFFVSIGFYELFVRRLRPLHIVFGIKSHAPKAHLTKVG